MSSKKTSLFSNNSNVLEKEKIVNDDNIETNSSNKLTKKFQKGINNVMRASKMFKNNNNIIAPELEGLNTFEKIIKLQMNLKIIDSTKQQFEGNQRKMLEKMNNGCLNYYKNKINMKKIFDYCSDINAEQKYEYNLLATENSKELLKDIYDNIFNFIFLIRNDNKLMLKIIDNCNSENYEDLSDFLVNFCYEDTINSSFIQEDMLILIYLIIEKCIIKIIPYPELEEIENINKIDLYDRYIKNNILYYIFLSLTRKADIRNYLCSILHESIIRVENLRRPLSIEYNRILYYLNNKDEEKKKLLMENRNSTMKPSKYSDQSGYLKRLSASTASFDLKKSFSSNTNLERKLKRKTLQLSTLSENILVKEDNNNEKSLKQSNFNNKFENENNKNEKLDLEDVFDDVEFEEEEIEKNDNDIYEEIDIIDPLFITTETTTNYIKNKLKEYEEYILNKDINNFNNDIVIAMKEYLNNLIKDINSEHIKIEKYSNIVLINSLKTQKLIKNNDSFNTLIEVLKDNHQIIIEAISEILSTIKDNYSFPFFIKSILTILDFLLDYKFKSKLSLYNRYMIKANFLFGNIILPVLQNPNYNGIITNEIISDITKENLDIIVSILNMMLSGKLFSMAIDPCMTIFNQYIIEILPIVFQIVENVTQDFILPEFLDKLTETINDIDDINRKIDYNYFEENDDEKFHFQSICFSIDNIYNLLKSVINYKKYIDEKGEDMALTCDEEYKKKEIIENIIKNEDFLRRIYENQKQPTKIYKEFIYMSNIKFMESFENKIKSILKDNFIGINPPIKDNFKEDEVSRFKRCLSEVLTYVNLLHKEYFPNFISVKKENIIHEENIMELLIRNKKKLKYDKIINNKTENNINVNNIFEKKKEEEEDPDFKIKILPYILLHVKSELGSNSSENFYQRILYCCSYIQMHIDLLPLEYVLDNYKLLFIELIKDTESSVNILRNNILNQLNIKIRGIEKTNMIMNNTYQQIKNMEKMRCIEYLYSKLEFPSKFEVKYEFNGLIKNVKYLENSTKMNLSALYESIPEYKKFEDRVDDIIDFEEKTNMGEALKSYFKNLKALIRKENIVKKYTKEDIETICLELENYLLYKLYDKLFPLNQTKYDIKFYKKCLRLGFVEPEHLINDKNTIDKKLCETSMYYINDMDNKCTPSEKIKCMGKAFNILQNSITFSTGKNELGVDDTIKPLIYMILKSKPQKIYSNFKYCQLYLDPDLSKKQYGILLTQICMITDIINDMKYTDLIGITKEQFGDDEE